LGETFEYSPKDKSYRFFAEQVSHHPPVSVAVAESKNYLLQLEMNLKMKYYGNSAVAEVNGTQSLKTQLGDHFTWNHLETSAYNVIIGGMWVDHYGTLEIKNHTTGDKCVLTATKCGYFSRGRYETSAKIFDGKGNLKLKLAGKWFETLSAIKVDQNGNEGDAIPLWKRPEMPTHKWNWFTFNDELNHFDSDYKSILPDSESNVDSRLRSDRLSLEKGENSNASNEKYRLENEQRQREKALKSKNEPYHPKYFNQNQDGTYSRVGDYWQDRSERIKKSGKTFDNLEELKFLEKNS